MIDSTLAIDFDVYEAPCKWEQITETPFICQERNGRVHMIAVTQLPGGSMLDLFPFLHNGKTYSLFVQSGNEKAISGSVVDEEGISVGTFAFEKIANSGELEFCFHQGQATIKRNQDESVDISVYSLRFPHSGAAYCCDKFSLGACTISETTCELGVMASDYSMFKLSGTMVDGICAGSATSLFPLKPAGTFTFIDRSECGKQRYDR